MNWDRVQAIFLEAAELDGQARSRFLDERCAGDAALRSEVESLLAAEGASSLLDAGLDDLALLLEGDGETTAGTGTADGRAGPYRVVEEIGRGGMGVVYRAERDDAQYTREVALKLVTPTGVDREELARRFARERRILAGLEHPNIARLYDAGVTEDGRSWLAMELIDGIRIDRWCDERQLDVDARLRVFEAVLRAVDYAHRNLVVHRDLKPSNILVTDEGDVKLLDFGIAKLLAEEEALDTGELTRRHQRVLTPEYASPEQLDGGGLTTASDVYALGVLLHELLTGRRPDVDAATRDLGTRPSVSVTRSTAGAGSATTFDPVAAARARGTTPEGLRRLLRGDLDTLIAAALEADPERRFPTAAALLDDVVRYREGRPLRARPPSATYRVRKYVARNRPAVAAAAIAGVALIAATFVSMRQARLAEQERDVARAVSTFLEGVFISADPFGATQRRDTLPVGALLDDAVARLDVDLANQPVVRARMRRILGSVHQGLGVALRADSLLSTAIGEYEALGRSDDPEVQRAEVGLARIALDTGDPREAERRYRRAIELAETRLGSDAREVAELRLELVGPLLDLNRLDDAEAELARGLAVLRDGLGDASPEVARHLNLQGSLQYRQGRVAEATETMRAGVEMSRETVGADHPQTTVFEQNLGLMLHRAGRSAEAEPLLRDALERFREQTGGEHPNLAPFTKTVANVLEALDRWDEAEPLYREALDLARQSQGPLGAGVSDAAHDLAQALGRRARYDEALVLMNEAVAIDRAAAGPESPDLGMTLIGLGDLLQSAGDGVGAEAAFRESVDVLRLTFSADHPRLLAARAGLGVALAAQGRRGAATALFDSLVVEAGAVVDRGVTAALVERRRAEAIRWLGGG